MKLQCHDKYRKKADSNIVESTHLSGLPLDFKGVKKTLR